MLIRGLRVSLSDLRCSRFLPAETQLMSEKWPQRAPQEIKLATLNVLAASTKTLDFPGTPRLSFQ
jgi:hypothetical protein